VKLQTLISADSLAKALKTDPIIVVDCRVDLSDAEKGEHDYLAGHIPGAVYARLDRDLSDLAKIGLGRHPLPDEAAFSAVLSSWGWTPDVPVVAYDAANGALAAARLWWLLRLAGHSNVAVLDGGLPAWQVLGLPLEASRAIPITTSAAVRFNYTDVVLFDELKSHLTNHSALLLDARATPRYRGEVEPLDRVAGHVPGALNRPFSDNLQTNGCFKSATELQQEFAELLQNRKANEVIHMCGSGVTACHNLLAMEHAGLLGSRLFAPSWSGWISDPTRPVAIG